MGFQRDLRLTIGILAWQSESLLHATIRNIEAVADEIIVVDLGSTDDTPALARKRATKAIIEPWNNDYSAARNKVLAVANGDFILWLNEGETVSPDQFSELRQQIEAPESLREVVLLPLRRPPENGSIAGEIVFEPRIHPIRNDLRFRGRIREELFPAIELLGLTKRESRIAILAPSQEPSPERSWQSARRRLDVSLLAIDEEGRLPRILLSLGEAYSQLGDTKASAAAYRDALDRSEVGSIEQLESYYGLLTALDQTPGNREAQLSLCLTALETFPLDAQLLCALGGYLNAKGRLDLGIRAYQAAIEKGQICRELAHLDGLRDILLESYSRSLDQLGQKSEARLALEREILKDPSLVRSTRRLVNAYLVEGREVEALRLVGSIARTPIEVERLRDTIRGATAAVREDWRNAVAWLRRSFDAGCRDPLCLRWCYLALTRSGLEKEAVQVRAFWKEIDPIIENESTKRSDFPATSNARGPYGEGVIRRHDLSHQVESRVASQTVRNS